MIRRKVITVDGLAGTGKTTLSRKLAEMLGFVHVNTGAAYRVVGFLALEARVDPDDSAAVLKVLIKHNISFLLHKNGRLAVALDGKELDSELRSPQVSEYTSRSSLHPQIRSALMDIQRNVCPERNIVAEGRDMGTVVFHDADLKFFITADESVRADRRISELSKLPGSDVVILRSQMTQEVVERDRRDTERAISPTVPAKNAIIIDNSARPIERVLDEMLLHVKTKL